MASARDKAGRPIVVLTGTGVVTSLGAGKLDNWTKLTAGKSGVRAITRFPTDGLKTRIAGTVDFMNVEPYLSPQLCERLSDFVAEEAISESGIGSRGRFPGPLFLAVPPIEIEWPQRLEVIGASGTNGEKVTYDDALRGAATGRFAALHPRFQITSVADHVAEKFGTKGSPISLSPACAPGATAIQLGVEARAAANRCALCTGTTAQSIRNR